MIERLTREQMDVLDARHDACGNEIGVGTRVRYFECLYRLSDGRVEGLELTGKHANYFEGVVTAIEWLDGCNRYSIRVDRQVDEGEELTEDDESPSLVGCETIVPVNGVYEDRPRFETFAIMDA